MLPVGRNLLTLSRLSHVWTQSTHKSCHDTLHYIHSHFTVYQDILMLCTSGLQCTHIICTHAPTHVRACMNVLNCIRRILVHKDRYIGWQMLARFPGHTCGLTHQVLTMQFCLDFLYIYLLCMHTCMHICMYVRTYTDTYTIVCTYFSDITLCAVCVK